MQLLGCDLVGQPVDLGIGMRQIGAQIADALAHLLFALHGARPVIVAVAEISAIPCGGELDLGGVETPSSADFGLLRDRLLARQAGHFDRQHAARLDQRRRPLDGGHGLLPPCGGGLDRGLDFGDPGLELKDAAVTELAGLAGKILLRRLGGRKLGGRTRALIFQPRHLSPEIIEPGAIAACVNDVKDRIALVNHAELRGFLRLRAHGAVDR
ncbi:hypothetical protein [Bradyrhizobium sp. BR 1433]|uniref:hypothetical protein n=1 Tax=Bradyrhizobium sp. BR 1433 TaxID=3447967 RepID=UPI003EE698B2